MAMNSEEKYNLEEFLDLMKDKRARHTELITVYVPAGFDINLITKQLEAEKSTATNIKSTTTRKNVQEALENLIRITKQMKQTPKNGVALFSGNVFKEGKEEFISEIFEPPEPLSIRLYRCDQTFVLEPLEEMLEVKEVYGLVVLDRKEATIGLLVGKKIKTLQKFNSMVPGKTTKGGQCLSPDTLIMKYDGEIIEIKDSHNPLFIISENFNNEKTEITPVITKWENKKQLFKIVTKYPRLEIKASKDHLFFVRTENGIGEKPLAEIKEGDFLIMPEKINISGELQKIKSKNYYNSFKINEQGRKLLEEKRIANNLSQKELAEKIGITQTAISTYEIGKRNISKNLLNKLCNFLNLDFKEFISNYIDFPKSFILPDRLDVSFAQFLGYLWGMGVLKIIE